MWIWKSIILIGESHISHPPNQTITSYKVFLTEWNLLNGSDFKCDQGPRVLSYHQRAGVISFIPSKFHLKCILDSLLAACYSFSVYIYYITQHIRMLCHPGIHKKHPGFGKTIRPFRAHRIWIQVWRMRLPNLGAPCSYRVETRTVGASWNQKNQCVDTAVLSCLLSCRTPTKLEIEGNPTLPTLWRPKPLSGWNGTTMPLDLLW